MAFQEYLAVLNSNLYEHKGIAKSVLSRIAMLMIAPPEDDESGRPKTKSDPDEGWCVATQAYLAAQLGCSETEIKRWVKVFLEDGTIIIDTFRNKRGHKRNKMQVNMEWVLAHKMERDSNGEFIREACPQYRRGTTWTPQGNLTSGQPLPEVNPSGQSDTRPQGKLPSSLGADCKKPGGRLPASEGFQKVCQKKAQIDAAKQSLAEKDEACYMCGKKECICGSYCNDCQLPVQQCECITVKNIEVEELF